MCTPIPHTCFGVSTKTVDLQFVIGTLLVNQIKCASWRMLGRNKKTQMKSFDWKEKRAGPPSNTINEREDLWNGSYANIFSRVPVFLIFTLLPFESHSPFLLNFKCLSSLLFLRFLQLLSQSRLFSFFCLLLFLLKPLYPRFFFNSELLLPCLLFLSLLLETFLLLLLLALDSLFALLLLLFLL